MAFIAAAIWALLWQPVGRVYGWWAGAGAFVAGGFAGLLLGYLLIAWINRLKPHRHWLRTTVVFAGLLVGMIAYVGVPLWVLSMVRAV
jgi:ABC-type lipoprotein release transport system permease subunit